MRSDIFHCSVRNTVTVIKRNPLKVGAVLGQEDDRGIGNTRAIGKVAVVEAIVQILSDGYHTLIRNIFARTEIDRAKLRAQAGDLCECFVIDVQRSREIDFRKAREQRFCRAGAGECGSRDALAEGQVKALQLLAGLGKRSDARVSEHFTARQIEIAKIRAVSGKCFDAVVSYCATRELQ